MGQMTILSPPAAQLGRQQYSVLRQLCVMAVRTETFVHRSAQYATDQYLSVSS